MMKPGRIKKSVYRNAEFVYLAAGAVSSFLVWLMDLEGDEKWLEGRTLFWAVIQKIQWISIYLLAFLAVVVVTCIIIKRLSCDPWVIDKIQQVLDGYQNKVFLTQQGGKDGHRVTLFRYRENLWLRRHWTSTHWYWPPGKKPIKGDYLVPFLRSGHNSQESNTMFYVDPNNSRRTEGIAGRAWCERRTAFIPQLPEITENSSANDKMTYAQATYCDPLILEKYIQEDRIPPRSIAAIPIECNGNLWGVVVLDSHDPQGVTRDSIENYTLTIALIGYLLERA